MVRSLPSVALNSLPRSALAAPAWPAAPVAGSRGSLSGSLATFRRMASTQQLRELAEATYRLADAHPDRAVDGPAVAAALGLDPDAEATFDLFEEAQRRGLIDGYWAGGMALPTGLARPGSD